MSTQISRVHVIVGGRVQGVGFRYSCASFARAAGLAGWVRNLPNGAVEAVFEGLAADVGGAVEWVRHGPQGASVATVDVSTEPAEQITGFEIR